MSNYYDFNCQKCGKHRIEHWTPLTLWPWCCCQMMSFGPEVEKPAPAEKESK